MKDPKSWKLVQKLRGIINPWSNSTEDNKVTPEIDWPSQNVSPIEQLENPTSRHSCAQ